MRRSGRDEKIYNRRYSYSYSHSPAKERRPPFFGKPEGKTIKMARIIKVAAFFGTGRRMQKDTTLKAAGISGEGQPQSEQEKTASFSYRGPIASNNFHCSQR